MRLLLLCCCIVLLTACGSTPPRPRAERLDTTTRAERGPLAAASAEQVTLMALAMIGTPYRFGGSELGGFDCSGLSQYVYAHSAGVELPRNAARQSEWPGRELRRNQLRTGDLVFFETVPRQISHVALYVGEGRFVHAPSAGSKVRMDRIDDAYWATRFRFGKRVLR